MSQEKLMLLVVSKVKAKCKAHDASASMEAIEHLSGVVEGLLEKAVEKAKADGRKVVKVRDFE